MELKDVSQKEVFRYLGYKNNTVDETTQNIAIECITELLNSCRMNYTYKTFYCIVEYGKIIIDNRIVIQSKNLSKNLAECNELILFAATLGIQADMLIQKYTRLDMSKAVVMQAAAAAVIEQYCDQCQYDIEQQLEKKNLFLRPRFSPGYGDFDLKHQKDIVSLLDCNRKIGLTLTDSLLLAPCKSVTAVMGISNQNRHCNRKGCEVCTKTNCTFRRG